VEGRRGSFVPGGGWPDDVKENQPLFLGKVVLFAWKNRTRLQGAEEVVLAKRKKAERTHLLWKKRALLRKRGGRGL